VSDDSGRGNRRRFGSAINTGVAAANTEYVLILSAHCALPGPRWLELALRHFADDRVVAVNGALIRRVRRNRVLSAEERLIVGAMDDIVVQDRPFVDAFAGFSNSCSLVRRSACTQFPFNEKMTYAEDKEWANRVVQAGHRIVFDAALGTFQGHIKKEGYRSVYQRSYKGSVALTKLYGHRVWTLRKSIQCAGLYFNNRTGVRRLAFLHPAALADYAGRISGARHASRRKQHCP
jgi:rhamnosyltransferase